MPRRTIGYNRAVKIAVLSDIHGNLPALETVLADIDSWQPDKVVVAGDIVNRGPCSDVCLDLILERQRADNWHVIRGNHEDYVLDCRTVTPDDPAWEIKQFGRWTLDQLNGRTDQLSALDSSYEWTPSNGRIMRVVHASMRSNRDGLYKGTADERLREQIAPAPAVFATGHTHRPFLRQIDDTQVVNVGSVGSPFDYDRRAAYGRFEWDAQSGWQAEIVRLPFDYDRIEQDYLTSGFLEGGGPMAQLMLVELRRARGLIFRWASKYQLAVEQGEISLEKSVRATLSESDVRPFTGPPGWRI